MSYRVVRRPSQGTVVVDADGHFSYTADPRPAGAGVTDDFVIQVRDNSFRMMSTGARSVRVPVSVTLDGAQSAGQPLTAAALTAATGTIHQVTTAGPDITGFDPARDKLDLGDVSVHNFIVVDTPEGVGFRNPWSGETAIVAGVSLGQLTVDSFTPPWICVVRAGQLARRTATRSTTSAMTWSAFWAR